MFAASPLFFDFSSSLALGIPKMRFSLHASVAALLAACLASHCHAQQEAPVEDRIAARMDLTAAKNNLRYYWQVEYPRQLRSLDQAIALTRTEIDSNKRLMRQYRPFTRFSIGQPFPITISRLEICIQASEYRLDDLIAERDALVRYRADHFNQLAFEVTLARQRVLALETPASEGPQTLPSPQ